MANTGDKRRHARHAPVYVRLRSRSEGGDGQPQQSSEQWAIDAAVIEPERGFHICRMASSLSRHGVNGDRASITLPWRKLRVDVADLVFAEAAQMAQGDF